jgi:protocatechuate 3,4-dioxygenase beta subunit
MWVTLEGAQPAAASASANTDARGDFTCTGLAPSEYDVSVRSTLGALGEKKHVDLTNVEVARVTLRLAGTAGIRVTLNGADGAHTPQVFAQPQDGMVVPAKRSGDELVFEHLPLGEYKVFTSGSAVPGDAGTLVALKYDGQVARITLPAPKLASIRGVVLDPEGNPVIDTWVRAASSNGLLGIYADTPNAAITDDRGQFQLAGLIPGLYDVCTRCDTESQRVTGVEAGATGVVLRLSAAAPQDPRAAH